MRGGDESIDLPLGFHYLVALNFQLDKIDLPYSNQRPKFGEKNNYISMSSKARRDLVGGNLLGTLFFEIL